MIDNITNSIGGVLRVDWCLTVIFQNARSTQHTAGQHSTTAQQRKTLGFSFFSSFDFDVFSRSSHLKRDLGRGMFYLAMFDKANRRV